MKPERYAKLDDGGPERSLRASLSPLTKNTVRSTQGAPAARRGTDRKSPTHRAILLGRKITRVDPIYQPVQDIIFLVASWCYGYYLAACQRTDPGGSQRAFRLVYR